MKTRIILGRIHPYKLVAAQQSRIP